MRGIEYRNLVPTSSENIEKAEKNVELWAGAFRAVWNDLQEIEAKEGKLDDDDPRLTAVKICGMRLDEAKTLLKKPNDTRTQIEA